MDNCFKISDLFFDNIFYFLFLSFLLNLSDKFANGKDLSDDKSP